MTSPRSATHPEVRDADRALARFVELSGDLFCVLDDAGIVGSAAGSSALLGRAAGDLVGDSLFGRVHAEDATAVRTRIDGLASGASPIRFEARLRCDDGAYRWIAWCISCETDGSLVVALRDATERKWVEREMRASLSLVEATLEATADGLLVADESGQVVTFNRRFLEMWGISDAVVFAGSAEIDRFCEQTLIADADAVHLSLVDELRRAAAAERYEVLNLVDGRVFDRYSRARRIGDASDGRVWSFRDVTERVRAERELRDLLSMGIEHAVEGIARLDERGRYTSVNAVFAKMMGRVEADFIGEALGSFCIAEDRARVLAARAKVAGGEFEPQEVELRVRHEKGSVVVIRALIVRAKGAGAGFHLFVRDITEQKALEQRLLIADRMTSMGTLAAGVAHEINNPLAFVIGNAYVLERRLSGLTVNLEEAGRAEVHELVAGIADGADRVRRIVRDLKMFSRSDDTTGGAVDVGKVLESSINMARNEIRQRARLVMDLGRVPPVQANDGQLAQVFLNLLVNAAHAIPEGDSERNEIRVTTLTDDDGRVVVEIRDTGGGIEEGVLPHIFDPFFTTKPVGIGTGLGLSVCHGIVSKLGGDIGVESKVGQGTTFRVRLRAAFDRPRTVPPVAQAPRSADQRVEILLIDDEVLIGTSLARLLAFSGYESTVCSGGREALDLLATRSDFRFILCDLMMPNTSGMEVFDELSRTAPDLARRIVFMTGGAYTPRAKAFLGSVANKWFEKPIDLPKLLEWMGETIRAKS